MAKTNSDEEILFFKDGKEFSSWLKKNRKKSIPVWLGFYKRALDKKSFNSIQAFDVAMAHGWSGNIVRGIDHLAYKVKFAPRKPGSVWSATNVKRFLQMRKAGLIQPGGEKAFLARDKKTAKQREASFTKEQLRQFKSEKEAWAFFNSQAPGYRKYMQNWVLSAKRAETQQRRLKDLISDSAGGTKLKRVVEANERIARRFEPGKTPVEQGKNLGLATGIELRSVGIETLEELKRVGWEQAFQKLIQMYPQRFSLNAMYALAGAVNDLKKTELDSEIKAECKSLFGEMKE